MTTARPGLTLEYLKAKRDALRNELHSDQHYENTPTLAYGEHDPLEVPVVPCERCGGYPKITVVGQGSRIRYHATCGGCGYRLKEPNGQKWQPLLSWAGVNLTVQNYRDLPLFGLRLLEPTEAHRKMVGIRRNLEIRTKLAVLEREIARREGTRPPGKLYQTRLGAYLKWALLALRLTKLQVEIAKSATHLARLE